MKRTLINSTLVFASVIFTVAVVEVAIRLLYTRELSLLSVDRWSYRASRPPAYKYSSYFGTDFLKEASNSVEFKSGYSSLAMRSGKYFNIESDGFRKTFNKEMRSSHDTSQVFKTIYIYGGSTIFGQEVPDYLTIPSLLSIAMESCPGRYVVKNRGLPSFRSTEQLELVQKEKLKPGDVVIFYDGFNDFHYNIHRDNPYFKSHLQLSAESKQANSWIRLLSKSAMLNKSALYALLSKKLEIPGLSTQRTEGVVQNASRLYWNNIVDANSHVIRSRASFFHFIQPIIYESQKNTPESKYLIDHPTLSSPGESITYSKYFRKFIGQKKSIAPIGLKSQDLTKIFSTAEASDVFLDHVHVNEAANQKLVIAILSQLNVSLHLGCSLPAY